MDPYYFNNNICLLAVQRAFGAQEIFSEPLDYKFFLKLLRQYKDSYQVKVFSFCLIPSSVYLVIGGSDCHVIACFLEDLNKAFCDFVRVRDEARSSLQISRSRIVVLEDDGVLIDIVSFVDSLPVRRGLVKKEVDYEWCSFRLRAFGIDNGMIERTGAEL